MDATRRTREEWRTLLSDMESSGQTQQQWCLSNNINYSTMREMRYRIAKEGSLVKAAAEPADKGTVPPMDWIKIASPSKKPPGGIAEKGCARYDDFA